MKWLIFQQGRYFGGSCPEGAVWEGPRENYVNASIPKDQPNNIFLSHFIIFVFVKIAPMQIFVAMYEYFSHIKIVIFVKIAPCEVL